MNNIFGTAGIRAQAGQFPLDTETLLKIGKTLASFFINKYGPNANLLIACDTRASSDLIKALIKSGLLTKQLNIYDAQILPTPVVNYMVHELKNYDAGIIITASHNPYTDNGIKLVDRVTGNLSLQEELDLSNAILNLNLKSDFLANGKEFHVRSIPDIYTQKILDQFSKQINTQAFKNIKIVIDCANGATSTLAPAIFTKLGFKVIAINTNPNGTNINAKCGATHPEILQKTVLKYGANFGFAFDGDGDRIIVVANNGEIKNGDEIIAFLATNPKYQDQTGIVGTIVSNLGLELWLADQNKKLIRTNVGEKNLLDAMQKYQYLIGGEPSGHIILQDFSKSSDGIFVAISILETARYNQNWQMTTFRPTPQISHNILVKNKRDLDQSPLIEVINKYQNLINTGRLIVRYSGTENLLRILLEGHDIELLDKIKESMIQELSILLN